MKVYDTKYVTVCTSCLLSVCHSHLLLIGRGNASPKHSQLKSHVADGMRSITKRTCRFLIHLGFYTEVSSLYRYESFSMQAPV